MYWPDNNPIITNKPGMFQNAKTYETGLSDFHKLLVTIIVRAPRGVNLTNSGTDVKLGLKVAIGLIVLGTICWDCQFNLRRSKIRGSLGVPAEFPPEKWSTPKN